MASVVMIKHPASGLVQKGYYGFSWTYLFFGWYVPLIRGELGVAARDLLMTIVTFGIWQIVLSFLYNRQHMTRKLMGGWVLADSDAVNALAAAKIGFVIPSP